MLKELFYPIPSKKQRPFAEVKISIELSRALRVRDISEGHYFYCTLRVRDITMHLKGEVDFLH
jgi:hypothetical protein